MFFKKPDPTPTVSVFGVVTTGISAIWIFSKLVSFVRYVTFRPVLDKMEHYQKNKCHCRLWHSNCNSAVKVGWHNNDDIRWEQNFEISKAFLSVETSVEELSRSGFPSAAPAEKILQNALIALKTAKQEDFLSESEQVKFARDLEHSFVADSLKNIWPLLAPKTVPSRHFVELFCENLEEKKDLFYSIVEEYHSLLEHLQCISYTCTTYTQRLMIVIKKYFSQMSSKDQLQLRGIFKILENFLKHNSELVDVKAKLSRASCILKQAGIRRVVAIDAEMVGTGNKGQKNMLGRVSLVNQSGCIYDKYVKPVQPVTDYRTFVSGIRPEDLIDAVSFDIVRREVRNLIKDSILVGHDLENDLDVLDLTHPAKDIRDTAFYIHFRRVPHEKPSLEYLARIMLGQMIQHGEHDSVEDARAALDIYLMAKGVWEWNLENLR